METTSSSSTRWLRPGASRRALLATLAALTLAASGCAGGGNKDEVPTSSPVEEEQSSTVADSPQSDAMSAHDPAEAKPNKPDITTTEVEDLGEGWTTEDSEVPRPVPQDDNTFIIGMRVGLHPGFDRVVVDFAGQGPVGYTAFWTDNPTEQGRGERLDLDGDTFLSVNITGVSFPITDEDYEIYYGDSDKYWVGDITAIYDSSFEGQAHVAIGMTGKHPYRIFTLEDPVRVVIDVQK